MNAINRSTIKRVFLLNLIVTAPPVFAGDSLYEPADTKQIPQIWRQLGNERLMYPLDMGQIAMKIGPERQLFLDNCLIAQASNIERQIHQPIRPPDNPVLKTLNGAIAFVFHVLQFDEPPRFRMWYWSFGGWHDWGANEQIRFGNSYAISEDGVHWKRPELNLYSIAGSPEKNIVIPYGMMQGLFYEPAERDPQKRFKALVCVEARNKTTGKSTIPEGYYLHTSPDGIHWKGDLSHYLIPSLAKYDIPQNGIGDTSMFWWDPYRNKYMCSAKLVIPGKIRCQAMMESDDLSNWSRATPTLLAVDPADQIYGHRGYPYQGMYVGLRWLYQPSFDPETHAMDARLDCSRDGKIWTRVHPNEPFMALNPKRDTWDCSRIKTNAMLEVGDKIYIYYTAALTALDIAKAKWAPEQVFHWSTGLATLRRDGFASLNAGAKPGRIVTRPLTFKGRRLFVNADIAQDGYLKAEVQDYTGVPVPPYRVVDCKAISGDCLTGQIQWQDIDVIKTKSATPLRLVFELKNAKLYSFWLK